jgi:uncharacterized membrane protein YphA (DoxX/SURF4 family)
MTVRDLGLLALRIAVGGTLVAHGVQKLFGWFGGSGIDQTGATFERLGFHPGKPNAIAAGLGEAGGGALLAVGLGTPGASAAVAGTMIVAASMHVERGFFNSKGGFEYPAVLGVELRRAGSHRAWHLVARPCFGAAIEPTVDAQRGTRRGGHRRGGGHCQTTHRHPFGQARADSTGREQPQ